jgi:glycosyltransferase involved in cell wall biosynthesis
MEEFNPLVSIVIPVYNGSNYMRQAIDSALNQTYKNIEILVINDGSKDATEQIALSYGSKIRYFNKENGGVASALNLGIKEMKGEYFSWLSHDDIYYPNKVERQIQELRGLEDRESIVYTDYELVDANLNHLYFLKMSADHELRKLHEGLYAVVYATLHGCSMLISKSTFTKVGLFDENLRNTQDYDLWFKIFKEGYQLKYVGEVLIKSRSHEEQDSKKSKNVKEECDSLWIKILSNLSDLDCEKIAGNRFNLLKTVAGNIKAGGYLGAYDFILKEMESIKIQNADFYNKLPLISVIITYFNNGTTIEKAIKSVLENGYSNLEVIIINDGSKDKKIEEEYKTSKNVKVFYKENGGVSSARNLGLDRAKGDFIQFLDGDDFLLPNKFNQQIEHFKNNPELDISFTNYKLFYVKKDKYQPHDVESLKLGNKQFETLVFNWQNPINIPIHTMLFKKDCFNSVRFDVNYNICEDYLVWVELAYKNKIFDFIDIDACVYNFWEENSHKDVLLVLKDAFTVVYEIKKSFLKSYYYDEYKNAKLQYLAKIEPIRKKKFAKYKLWRIFYKYFLRIILKLIYGRKKVKQKYDKRFL